MTKWQQFRLNMLFFRGPQMGYSVSARIMVPSMAELRVSWDLDEYKRWALRTKLRQAGVLRGQTRYERDRRRMRGLGGAGWNSHASVEGERHRLTHNTRVFERYERRVLPNPFVRAMRTEIRGVVVDLQQMEERLFRRILRDSLRRQWRYRLLWPLVKWFALKYAVAIALPGDPAPEPPVVASWWSVYWPTVLWLVGVGVGIITGWGWWA